MSMGPITLFDKSALQNLNVDEAVWFNNFYRANTTPLFFIETLANLEKEIAKGRTPEQVVGNLALKTPVLGAFPNVYHETLYINDLMGRHVEMRCVPVIAGGRPISTDKQKGIFYDQPPELDALARWEREDFLGVERSFARQWREALSVLDLRQNMQSLGVGSARINNLADARTWAVRAVRGDGRRYVALKSALEMLSVPEQLHSPIIDRWKKADGPSLPDFAPYAAHVFTIDVFFYLALGAGLISPDRPSNRIDIAYLYYLPFCMVFVSTDKLHARTAPLFMGDEQAFVWGQDLKADLAKLDAYYSTLTAEVRERGVMKFASEPPDEGDFLTTRLWDRFLPGWRERAKKGDRTLEDVGEAAILDALKPMMDAAKRAGPPSQVDPGSTDQVIISRRVPVRRGKWRLLPPEVE